MEGEAGRFPMPPVGFRRPLTARQPCFDYCRMTNQSVAVNGTILVPGNVFKWPPENTPPRCPSAPLDLPVFFFLLTCPPPPPPPQLLSKAPAAPRHCLIPILCSLMLVLRFLPQMRAPVRRRADQGLRLHRPGLHRAEPPRGAAQPPLGCVRAASGGVTPPAATSLVNLAALEDTRCPARLVLLSEVTLFCLPWNVEPWREKKSEKERKF